MVAQTSEPEHVHGSRRPSRARWVGARTPADQHLDRCLLRAASRRTTTALERDWCARMRTKALR